MKRILFFFVFFCIFNLFSCSDNITNSNKRDDNSIKQIIYVDGSVYSLTSDSISINHVVIKNNILIIDYSYLGGCGTPQINLFAEHGFEDTSPAQLSMRLVLHSYSNACKNIIKWKAYFDLKSASLLYKATYQRDRGVILLSIYNPSSDYYSPPPRYEF
jgi:hypothetical protein